MYSDFDSMNLLCQRTENLSRWLVFYHSSLLLQIQDYNSVSIQVSWKFSIDIMHCVSTEACPRPTCPKSATYVAQYELGETIKEPLPLPTYTCYHEHIKILSLVLNWWWRETGFYFYVSLMTLCCGLIWNISTISSYCPENRWGEEKRGEHPSNPTVLSHLVSLSVHSPVRQV